MTQPTATNQRQVDLEVKSAAPVEDKNHNPQWQLDIKYPWSQYRSKSWIDRDLSSDFSIMPGVYTCIVQRGNLIKRKDGSSGDGSQDFHYYWNIITFDLGADEAAEGVSYDEEGTPAPAKPIPPYPVAVPSKVPVYEDQEAIRRRSIERQVALKAVVEYASIFPTDDLIHLKLLGVAQDFYDWLSGAKGTPQEPPVSEPEGTVGQRIEPVAMVPAELPDAPADLTTDGLRDLCRQAGWEGSRAAELLGDSPPKWMEENKKTPAQAWQKMKAKYEEETDAQAQAR